MSMIKFPYTNLHELNLDWLIEKVKECYSPDNPPDDVVLSVNGDVGDVILYKEADVQLPDIEDTSWNFFRLADGSAVGIKFNKGLPLERVYGSSRFAIYDAGNPPPYPVTSVNGQTGAITIQIAFGSLTGDTVSFLTSSPAHSWSLDRETLDGSASIRLDTTNDEISAYIEYVSSDDTVHSSVKLLTPADIPSSSGVLSVNGAAGVVVLTAEDIHRTGSNSETVEHCLSSLTTDTQNLATKIGSVGSTSLQNQVNTINGTLADIQEDIGTVGATSLQDQVDTLNSKLATSYYNMTNIGVIRFVGKIAILDFINTSGQISSTGLQLPYTFVDDIRTICQYYNGSTNDIGELHINKNGSVYVRKNGAYVNATYGLGQAVAYLATL